MLRQLLIAQFLLLSAVAFAQPPLKVLVATGKEVQTQLISPGSWECTGGQTTPTGPPFCSPGTINVFFWNMSNKKVTQEVTGSAAAMLGGENITVVHGNFDGNYFGHMWGTFTWTVPEMGGRWEGTYAVTADQARGLVVNKAVGYGSGGKLEGLKLEYYAVNPGAGSPATFVAVVTSK